MPRNETPEQIAARTAKAKATRQAHKAERIWPYIEQRMRNHPCRCALHRGMTIEDLRPLGAGCTAPAYVCPNLDAYRRILQDPNAV